MLSQLYLPGLAVTAIAQSAGLAVNNLEIVIGYDDTFTKADFLAGRWDGAAWELFEVNWAAPADGTNTIGRYITGDVKPGRLSCSVELRALSQFLQQGIGLITSKTCRARLADFPSQVQGARCGLDVADFTVTGTITSASGQQAARDDARTEADDWFGDGVLTFTSGANDGLSQKVKTHELDSNGAAFTFSLPFPFAIAPGDAYSLVAGCRKRLAEDCRDKFDNVLNFQGEPHLPGADLATATPVVDAS